MASLEDVLDAFAVACDVWLSSSGDEECPTAEFAPLVRQAVGEENAKLRELVDELYPLADYGAMDASELDRAHDLMRELGIEVTP